MLGSTPQATSSAASILDLAGGVQDSPAKTEGGDASFGQTLDAQVKQNTQTPESRPQPEAAEHTDASPGRESEAESTVEETASPHAGQDDNQQATAAVDEAEQEPLKAEVKTELPTPGLETVERDIDQEEPLPVPLHAVDPAASLDPRGGKALPLSSEGAASSAKQTAPVSAAHKSELSGPQISAVSEKAALAEAEEGELDFMNGQDRGNRGHERPAAAAAGSSSKAVPFEQLLQGMSRPQAPSPVAAQPMLLNPSAGMIQTQGLPSPGTAVPQLQVQVPVQQNGWQAAMGERVVWMARQGMQQAQIQLNPRELGPIEVRVSVSNDQANVSFVAQQAQTREALDTALPRLREMFSEQGLNLSDASVSQQSKEQAHAQQREGHSGHGTEAQTQSDDMHDAGSETVSRLQDGQGLLDYYA